MLMLRLQRIGRRNEAHFKIVVIEKTKGPKSQKYVDIVGSYNPKLGRIIIDAEKAKTHLSNGVQPSDTVRNMLISQGILQGRKVNNLPQKSPVIDHEAIAKAKEEAEAKAKKIADEKAAAEEAAKAEAEEAPGVEPETEEPSSDDLAVAEEGAPEEVTKTAE